MRFVLALALLCALAMPAIAADPLRPDPKLTPGATDPAVTQATLAKTVCKVNPKTGRPASYTAGVRNVAASTKTKVFAEYGIPPARRNGNFEIDHLISLELGGANDIKNLWPQSYVTAPLNAHVKDALEDRLHALVCKDTVTLREAQDALRTDWVAAYRKYVGPLPK